MERECFRCGASDSNVKLVEVINNEGIVNYCESCLRLENFPFVRKPSELKLQEAVKPAGTVYDRLSRMSGITKDAEGRHVPVRVKPGLDSNKVNVSLREIVDKNFKSRLPSEKKNRTDLVENFNWKIMRARRLRKFTIEHLAREIGEPVSALKAAESGIVEDNEFTLLIKLEKVLEVTLIKDRSKIPSQATFGLDPVSKRELTVGDLRRMGDRDKEFRMRNQIVMEESTQISEGLDEEGSEVVEVKKKKGFFSRLFSSDDESEDSSKLDEQDTSEDLEGNFEQDYEDVFSGNNKISERDRVVRENRQGASRDGSHQNVPQKKRDLSDDEIRRLAFGGRR